MGADRQRAGPQRLDVEVEHVVPLLLGDVPGVGVVAGARVVDQDVDVAECLDGLGRHPRRRRPGW